MKRTFTKDLDCTHSFSNHFTLFQLEFFFPIFTKIVGHVFFPFRLCFEKKDNHLGKRCLLLYFNLRKTTNFYKNCCPCMFSIQIFLSLFLKSKLIIWERIGLLKQFQSQHARVTYVYHILLNKNSKEGLVN